MRIGFYIPPEKQRVGGLDLAISALRQALEESGSEVVIDAMAPAGLDVVHFHGLWQPRFLALARACQRLKIPFVVSPHGMLEPWAWRHKWWKKWAYFHLLEWSFINAASGILATSSLEKAHLARYNFTCPITEISLGLPENVRPGYFEARSELGWSDEEFILLYLSRIHPKKGLHLLLSALTSIGKNIPKLRLVVVGDGEAAYLSRIRRFIGTHASHLPPIDFIGPIWGDAKWKFFRGADLFCLPSYSENFGLAILESCQVGTPVLTTTGTPWTTFLTNNGFPVAQPNLTGISEALGRHLALGKIGMQKRLSFAESTYSQFSWSSISRTYREYYESIVAKAAVSDGFVRRKCLKMRSRSF